LGVIRRGGRMKYVKYQFNLTEKQVEMINKLIENEFQLASDMNETVENGVELISLTSYLNFELGFNQGYEKSMDVEE
ncbi:hypothetical protein HMPREF3224_02048, partial [Anaerococcus hydrogenalis]